MILHRELDDVGNYVLFTLDGQFSLHTHTENDDCIQNGCCIHNPSAGSVMNRENWLYNWRTDRGIMERICPDHEIGHPDFDSSRFLSRHDLEYENVHGCCGCCDADADLI